ncbi:acyltransferase domain-containing protein [Allofournierella sp.]|uniref:acyltransferase domain-containing protein n=1 Tax=Allofournierella sp. TaxID=1940256 RepID=UPI003AB9036F
MRTVREFAQWIGLPEQVADCAQHCPLSAQERRGYLSLFERDEAAFFEKVRAQPEPEQLALCLFVQYAMEREAKWRAAGIPGQVYRDTMSDLALWYGECLRRTGKPGLVEWDWLALSLKGKLYRLGRLQYRPRILKDKITAAGRSFAAGVPMLEIHIPAGGPLRPQVVRSSMAQAWAFFEKGRPELMYCHSWLLSPALQQLLPQNSNILHFQSLFEVYDEDFSFRQAEERVFGEIRNEIRAYPENTGLQKALKQFLLGGGRVGMGAGVIPRGLPEK